jgi:hypothetical protein
VPPGKHRASTSNMPRPLSSKFLPFYTGYIALVLVLLQINTNKSSIPLTHSLTNQLNPLHYLPNSTQLTPAPNLSLGTDRTDNTVPVSAPLLRSCLLAEPIIVELNCCRGIACFEVVTQ